MKKKVLIAIIAVLAIAAVCVAVVLLNKSSKGPENNDPKASVSATQTEWEATTITTDKAKIKEGDAIKYISDYSAEDLSLTKEEKKDCDFLVSNTGIKIKGDYYICVTAVVKSETGKDEEGNTTYTFDKKGEYFIRYDGKQVLKKDMTKDDKYIELDLHK